MSKEPTDWVLELGLRNLLEHYKQNLLDAERRRDNPPVNNPFYDHSTHVFVELEVEMNKRRIERVKEFIRQVRE